MAGFTAVAQRVVIGTAATMAAVGGGAVGHTVGSATRDAEAFGIDDLAKSSTAVGSAIAALGGTATFVSALKSGNPRVLLASAVIGAAGVGGSLGNFVGMSQPVGRG